MSQISEDTDSHKADNTLKPQSYWGITDFSIDLASVKKNLNEIKQKVAHCKPKIIAVTKYFDINAMENAYKAGIRDFGESRATDAINKIERLPKEMRENSTFHFIGHLQSNKAKDVVKYFNYIHSVDSYKIADIISKCACSLNKRERVLLQVNNTGESQKFGYSEEQLYIDFPKIIQLENIEVAGLMNMATLNANPEDITKTFKELRVLRDNLEQHFKVRLPELSMGMSNDYEYAVKEGATMIRIGRKLFK